MTNAEGNHGEDVKEYYFYVDNLPTHSYQRYLYKYPQAEFPYNELVAVNRSRSRHEFEYELIDTGVFDDSHYFDVEVEHAKAGPTALKFSGLWGLVSGFPGLVTVWLHVGRGGVTGCGGP